MILPVCAGSLLPFRRNSFASDVPSKPFSGSFYRKHPQSETRKAYPAHGGLLNCAAERGVHHPPAIQPISGRMESRSWAKPFVRP